MECPLRSNRRRPAMDDIVNCDFGLPLPGGRAPRTPEPPPDRPVASLPFPRPRPQGAPRVMLYS